MAARRLTLYAATEPITPVAVCVASIPWPLSESGANVTEATVQVRIRAKISASMPPKPSPAISAPSS
jgi:hypothetical protein